MRDLARTAALLVLLSSALAAHAQEPPSAPGSPSLPPLPAPSASPSGSGSSMPLAAPPPQARSAPVAPAPCTCEAGCSGCAEPRQRGPGGGVVGVRGQGTQVAAGRDSGSFGVTFSARLEGHDGEETPFRAGRGAFDLGLGGGTGDVEGLIGGALLFGVRLPVVGHHAPFLRLGLAGEYQGNARYLYSRFDLPLGELGYQYAERGRLFELGARVSPVLTGRLRGDFAPARVLSSSFSAGAFVTLRGRGGRLDLLYTRVQATGDAPGKPVDTFQGLLCLFPVGLSALCADAQLLTTSVFAAGNASTDPLRVFTLGFTLGLGKGFVD